MLFNVVFHLHIFFTFIRKIKVEEVNFWEKRQIFKRSNNLVNVELDISGCKKITFQGCRIYWSR